MLLEGCLTMTAGATRCILVYVVGLTDLNMASETASHFECSHRMVKCCDFLLLRF